MPLKIFDGVKETNKAKNNAKCIQLLSYFWKTLLLEKLKKMLQEDRKKMRNIFLKVHEKSKP